MIATLVAVLALQPPARLAIPPVNEMSGSEKLSLLMKMNSKQKPAGTKQVFSCSHWGSGNDNFVVESPSEVSADGARFDGPTPAGHIQGGVLECSPTDPNKSHLIIADVRAIDSSQTLAMREVNARLSTTLNVQRNHAGHIALIVPAHTARFQIYVESNLPHSTSFSLSRITIEDLH